MEKREKGLSTLTHSRPRTNPSSYPREEPLISCGSDIWRLALRNIILGGPSLFEQARNQAAGQRQASGCDMRECQTVFRLAMIPSGSGHSHSAGGVADSGLGFRIRVNPDRGRRHR